MEHLRSVYREYLRKPANVFRKMVERACEEVRRRGPGSDAGGDALEAMEAAHLAERENGRGGSGSGSDVSDSDDDSDDDPTTTPTTTPTGRATRWTRTSRGRTSTIPRSR